MLSRQGESCPDNHRLIPLEPSWISHDPQTVHSYFQCTNNSHKYFICFFSSNDLIQPQPILIIIHSTTQTSSVFLKGVLFVLRQQQSSIEIRSSDIVNCFYTVVQPGVEEGIVVVVIEEFQAALKNHKLFV